MRVVVLMSTYQGEIFIAEQIESILNQLPPQGLLRIRDDGSTDRTVKIIESFKDSRIEVSCGSNMGFSRSFFALMAAAPTDADMVMLSDQDDVWLPHKIERAWQYLQGSANLPTLYCARQQLVDSKLQKIALSERWPRPPSFENALTENIVTGCTAALNAKALRLVLQIQNPQQVYFHDWWLYLVVSGLGRVVVDDEATINYRQHGRNAIGKGTGLGRYLAVIRFLRKTSWLHIMYGQVEEFKTVYAGQLAPSQQLLLEKYFNRHEKAAVWRLVFSWRRFRQFLLGDILLRGMIIFEMAFRRKALFK